MSDFGDEGALVPDLPEPIRGYRAWSFDGCALTGMGGVIWPAGSALKARCQKMWGQAHDPYQGLYSTMYLTGRRPTPEPVAPHECPSPDKGAHNGYGCGIYAYKDPTRFVGGGTDIDEGRIIGMVELGGKVYEHEHGYRAEHAMPAAFYGDPTDPILERLAVVYDVPIEAPPWEDAEVIRARVNELAQRQAEEWDADIARAAKRAANPPAEDEVRTAIGVDWEPSRPTQTGPKYPNNAGYSDAEIEHVARLKGYSPGVITSCINQHGHRYRAEVRRYRKAQTYLKRGGRG